jgi:hypothetical protein
MKKCTLAILSFILAIFLMPSLSKGDAIDEELIIEFSNEYSARQFKIDNNIPDHQLLDRYIKISSKSNLYPLLSNYDVKSIQPNYKKLANAEITPNDPLFSNQWGLPAVNYIPELLQYEKNNLFLGGIVQLRNQQIMYQQDPISENHFSITFEPAVLSRISVELDHVEGPWTLTAYDENMNVLGAVKKELPRLDILVPRDTYKEISISIEPEPAWNQQPSIINIEGVNHGVIAVIDSGVSEHEDLCNNILYSLGEDYIEGFSSPVDNFGHGTHVTGIIMACPNNYTGIAGVAGTAAVDVIPLKVLDKNGFGGDFEISQAVNKAINLQVDVINMSLAGRGQTSILQESVKKALHQNIPVVAAAGNWNISASQVYPASYPGVITVAGVNETLAKVPSSNFGTEIDISAPGYNILSTHLNNGYKTLNGTSMAAPFVSSAAAMLKLKYPNDDLVKLRSRLLHSSKDIQDKGYDPYSGFGMLDIKNALKYSSPHRIEWLTLKENQPIPEGQSPAIAFSSELKGQRFTLLANEQTAADHIVDSLWEEHRLSDFLLGKSTLNLYSIVSGNKKEILEMNITSVRNPDAAQKSFNDVPNNYWAYNEITDSADSGIVNGYTDGTFKPEQYITRKHSVMMIQRLFKWDNLKSYISPYRDVEGDLNIPSLSILAADHNDIVKGYKNNEFRPDNFMTRAQMALVLARALGIKQNYTINNPYPFQDVSSKDEYYHAIQFLTERNIITRQEKYRPNENITRAQFSAMLFRVNEYKKR